MLSPDPPGAAVVGGVLAPGAPAEGTLHLVWAEMGTAGIGGSFWRQFTPSFSSRALVILEETAGSHPARWLDGPCSSQEGHFLSWLTYLSTNPFTCFSTRFLQQTGHE